MAAERCRLSTCLIRRFDPEFALDRRLGISAAVLLCAIEGKQG